MVDGERYYYNEHDVQAEITELETRSVIGEDSFEVTLNPYEIVELTYDLTQFSHIDGSDGVDRINGVPGDNMINTQGGDDVIESGAGNDTVYAGQGNDYINSGSEADLVFAGAGR